MALVWSNICNICQNVRSREPHWLYLVVLTIEKHLGGYGAQETSAPSCKGTTTALQIGCWLPSSVRRCALPNGHGSMCRIYCLHIYIYIYNILYLYKYIHRVYIRIFYVYIIWLCTYMYLSIISVCVCLWQSLFPSFKHPPRLSRYFGLVLDYSSSGPISGNPV